MPGFCLGVRDLHSAPQAPHQLNDHPSPRNSDSCVKDNDHFTGKRARKGGDCGTGQGGWGWGSRVSQVFRTLKMPVLLCVRIREAMASPGAEPGHFLLFLTPLCLLSGLLCPFDLSEAVRPSPSPICAWSLRSLPHTSGSVFC